MVDGNEAAIALLEQRANQILEDARAQAQELRQAAARLRSGKHADLPQPHEYPEIRPGQWRGVDIRSALISYLNERPGGVITTRVAADLVKGGIEIKSKKKSEARRIVRVTIGNNRKIFDYDETTDTVKLVTERPTHVKRAGAD